MAARDPGYKDRFCGSAGTQLQICQGVGPWFPSLASVGAEQEAGVRSRCPGLWLQGQAPFPGRQNCHMARVVGFPLTVLWGAAIY